MKYSIAVVYADRLDEFEVDTWRFQDDNLMVLHMKDGQQVVVNLNYVLTVEIRRTEDNK